MQQPKHMDSYKYYSRSYRLTVLRRFLENEHVSITTTTIIIIIQHWQIHTLIQYL